jgi:hypothetical protein
MREACGVLMLLLLGGCVAEVQAEPGAGGTGKRPWDFARVGNLERLPGLAAQQRKLLESQGFFLAPQNPPHKKPTTGQPEARGETQATHLFHVYERNDYLRFPSYVTVDLAIDTTHAYFDALLRDLEQYQLGSMLANALTDLMAEAEKVRASATTAEAREAASRVTTFLAVGLRLLRAKAVLPESVRTEAEKLVRLVIAAQGTLPVAVTKSTLDMTQTKPRGHYTRTPALERYFRAMSWLGMVSFAVEGPEMDLPAVALLARVWAGSSKGRDGFRKLMDVTAAFVGGADTAGPDVVVAALRKQVADVAAASPDTLVGKDLLLALGKELASTVPVPRIGAGQGAPRQIRLMGRRAFEDAVAMEAFIAPLLAQAKASNLEALVSASMGARGAAAMLGSDVARAALLAGVSETGRAAFATSIEAGRRGIVSLPAERWSNDAYHGTLLALRPLWDPLPAGAPPLLQTDAWRLRALQAFAGGWAELRHDTILYGEQSGAECDAEDYEPPPGWVEPVPEVYQRLATMVRNLQKRLNAAGVDFGFRPKGGRKEEGAPDARFMTESPATKTKKLLRVLDDLARMAADELQGKLPTLKDRESITTLGGAVEWLFMVFANSDMLNDRDADMAVVADVFTWRPSAQALQVGVARPDLIYAIIPSPNGPVLARGAVMSYREFLHPTSDRLTDEAWRTMIAAGRAPKRPDWLAPLYTDAVGPVTPHKEPQGRCGPSSGAGMQGL